ncbi:hypothetical protein OSB04_004806 [Centaurea solstitialis]|uniref:Pentatricopeptide repeat-containing protein n=1 Tax=Centaurea solstitialis TaxID=347529 RepID=A0AA38TQD0_9ASTR|nr:hypothetical protein OSB04_004806 [Centaurea solstitialis]
MASSSLRLHLHLPFSSPNHHSAAVHLAGKPHLTVRCGPRDNRGPLHKGRTLSIEAIQAVQSLKRSNRSNPTATNNNDVVSKTLSRLVKSDLIATFNELIRQDQFDLALKVFSAVRSEFWYKAELSLYAKLVTAMASKGMENEIVSLIVDLDPTAVVEADSKGLITLIKALLAADMAESTVRIYEMMKAGGWRCKTATDEYVGKVLSRGLRRLGKKKVADEIDLEIGRVGDGVLESRFEGLITLIKALLAADMAESTVRIYEMMKAGGWRCKTATDDYVGKVLSRGLRRLGKKKVADEIDLEIGRVSGGVLEIVTAMVSKGMKNQIDCLILDLDPRAVVEADSKGLITLIKALIAVDMAESTVGGGVTRLQMIM